MPSRDVTIVMYHAIDVRPHPYAIHPDAFRRQLELIAGRYAVVPLRELEGHRDEDGGGRRVAITFDDGFRDFMDNAYPVLAEMQLPCTMFVPTAYIGRTNVWDAEHDPAPPRPIMDAGDLAALARDPRVEIGSHTVDHVRMATLSPQAQRRQAIDSKRVLEEITGVPVRSFAYPYGQLGDFSPDSASILAGAGYTIAVTTHWGTRLAGTDMLALRRIHFRNGDDDGTVRAKIEGRYDWMALKERAAFTLRSLRHRSRTTRPCTT